MKKNKNKLNCEKAINQVQRQLHFLNFFTVSFSFKTKVMMKTGYFKQYHKSKKFLS